MQPVLLRLTQSWALSHLMPQLMVRTYNHTDNWNAPCLDPTKEEVLFYEEMSSIFSDPFIHIGGDEVAWRPSQSTKRNPDCIPKIPLQKSIEHNKLWMNNTTIAITILLKWTTFTLQLHCTTTSTSESVQFFLALRTRRQ